jgi:high-affinity K+ transport system ATPase subunit B
MRYYQEDFYTCSTANDVASRFAVITAAFKTTFFTTFYFSINNTKQYEKKNFI